MNNKIKEKLSLLKELPGCYLMKNSNDEVIYVGKAKKLVNRVSSYFLLEHSGKTAKLVEEIDDFDYIITNSEKEALLLEINLIHQYMPHYNILLRDSKAYPYIELHNTSHPYLSIARNMNNKNSKYFGPYSDSSSAYETLNLLNRLFPLRKCNHIPNKVCLYYHINQCLGPCINKIDSNEYKIIIDKISKFLNGNNKDVYNSIKQKMIDASNNLNYELANEYKKLLESLDHISSRQVIQLNNKEDFDIFGVHYKDGYMSVSSVIYRGGILRNSSNMVVEYYDDESQALIDYIIQFYKYNTLPKQIIVPSNEESYLLEQVLNIKVITPISGSKFDLLTMAMKNAYEQMSLKYMVSKKNYEERNKVIDDLKNIVGLDTLETIELIDNSHYNGSEPVSAVVVFKNMLPNKKLYRKYKINSINSKDDLSSMKEILYRRYYRKLIDNESCSDLLIVDGGLNQINAAKETINSLNLDIKIVGLSKDDKHNTDSLVLEDGRKVYIRDNKNLYFFLAKMQDEVHNFVINYHIDRRSKNMIKSVLDDVKGLGDKTKEKLLDVYKDIETIKNLSVEELSIYMNKNVAISLKDKLK